MTNKNRQPAGCATVGSDHSADESTAGQSANTLEFLRVFLLADPRSRRQICHLIQAFDAARRRSVFEWLYHWGAFVVINPRAALRVSPTLRRITQAVCVGLCVVLMLAFATACSGTDGSAADELRATAQAAGVQIGTEIDTGNEGAAQVAPTLQPTTQPTVQPVVQISATQTPQPLPTSTPEIVGFNQPATADSNGAALATQTPQPTVQPVGIDESAQPCPARFWKRGTCTATAAQIEQYAHEVQP